MDSYSRTVLFYLRKESVKMEATGKDWTDEDRALQRIRLLRSEDVSRITAVITPAKIDELRWTIRYYPLRFLGDATEAYIYGFDNAVIFYAGIAIELALLALKRDEIKQELQLNPQLKVDFKWLIDHAGNLLDSGAIELCHNIRIMRNCYTHYENIVAHLAWMHDVEEVEIWKKLQAELGDNPEALKFIDSLRKLMDDLYKQEGMLPIRFEHLEGNKEIMPFIEKRYKEYMNWIIAWYPKKQHLHLTQKEFDAVYSVEAFDAFECINWAFDVVRKLNLI